MSAFKIEFDPDREYRAFVYEEDGRANIVSSMTTGTGRVHSVGSTHVVSVDDRSRFCDVEFWDAAALTGLDDADVPIAGRRSAVPVAGVVDLDGTRLIAKHNQHWLVLSCDVSAPTPLVTWTALGSGQLLVATVGEMLRGLACRDPSTDVDAEAAWLERVERAAG